MLNIVLIILLALAPVTLTGCFTLIVPVVQPVIEKKTMLLQRETIKKVIVITKRRFFATPVLKLSNIGDDRDISVCSLHVLESKPVALMMTRKIVNVNHEPKPKKRGSVGELINLWLNAFQ